MKKFTSILLALAMLAAMTVIMIPTVSAAWDGSSVSAGLVGSGTEFDPYLISSENDLALVAKQVNEAVVKDRIHISREGIFVVVLTINKKTGRLVKTPDIVSRAFIYLDDSEELIGKIRHYLRTKAEHSKGSDADLKALKDEIKEDVTHILFDATGHTPIVIPVINKV